MIQRPTNRMAQYLTSGPYEYEFTCHVTYANGDEATFQNTAYFTGLTALRETLVYWSYKPSAGTPLQIEHNLPVGCRYFTTLEQDVINCSADTLADHQIPHEALIWKVREPYGMYPYDIHQNPPKWLNRPIGSYYDN